MAITDHHDFVFLPYMHEASKTEIDDDGTTVPEAQQRVVFPGLELTLEVPCQVLLIFSADFSGERLSTVLDKLDIDPFDAADSRGADPQKLKFLSLRELHERLARPIGCAALCSRRKKPDPSITTTSAPNTSY